MILYREIAVFRGGQLLVEVSDDGGYRLRYGTLVEYANGRRRLAGGRWAPYEFRSVEQLRYDFERDVRAAGGRLGG
ncbi:MAG TPA: hypothetical protein VK043_03050 [Burkholderiales bacterium]|nr:hypothetical protein [Burkholderiales bacterium]